MSDRREEWKEYRRTHPDKTNLERQRRFQERHNRDPEFVERKRAYQRAYYEANRKASVVKPRVSAEAKKERARARAASYYARNRAVINERRRAKRRAAKANKGELL